MLVIYKYKTPGVKRIILHGDGRPLSVFGIFFLLLLTASFCRIHDIRAETSPEPPRIIEIDINGSINPSTVDYIQGALSLARQERADALLVLLDTPGGLLNSTKDIVKMFLNSEIPVIAYVYPRGSTATSAGVFITLSAHVAAMSPGTSIGAASPVMLGAGRKKDYKEQDEKDDSGSDVMEKKIENYAASFMESIAQERGRNAQWAVDSVRKSVSVTAVEALSEKVIDIISADIPSLLRAIDGKNIKVGEDSVQLATSGAVIKRVDMNLRQKVVNVLSTPDIAFLLLSLGSLGILLEFYNPGLIFPGVAGLISLIIGFVSLQILPFNYAGLVLLFVAVALFVSEVYVTSYGLLSLAGLISFVFGGLLLFDTTDSDLGVSGTAVAAVAVPVGLLSVFIVYFGIKSFGAAVQGGFEGMVGQKGEVVFWHGGKGKIYIQGEYWEASADRSFAPGDRVQIIRSGEGLNLKVGPATD